MNTFDRVKEILIAYAPDPEVTITADSDLIADIGLNSFDLASMIYDIEQEFDLKDMTDGGDIRELRIVSNLITFIDEQRGRSEEGGQMYENWRI
ncbi:MAG: acyl carrier protein [Clostridiales Family XIII bacterium]|jgi:acyl carrier protein|nr:acyl carrier protein [Clostridiales Family XIII bacterium]